MVCPNCQSNSIPFVRLWLKSGRGSYRCPSCSATCRVRKSATLFIASLCLGFAAGLGLLFGSGPAFAVAIAVVLVIDALMDYRFRRLEVAEVAEGTET